MFILTYKRAFLWQFIAVIVMDLLSLMSQKLRQWPVRGEGSLDSAAEDGSGLAGDTAPRTPGLDIFKYQYVSQIKNNL